MTRRLIFLALLLFFSYAGFSQSLPAKALHPFGRSLFTSNGHVELIGSAAHFGYSFRGTACSLYAYLPPSAGHSYLQYELDGIYQKRIKIEAGNKTPVIISAPKNGHHTIWVYKTTEAQSGPVFIEKIEGKDVKPLTRPKASLIEFIGNSITCGAAADTSEMPCNIGVYHDHHNAYYAYGPRIARALKVNFMLSSVSGIGMYRNWNSDGPTMPQVYEKADLGGDSQRRWDFSLYQPRIVSIALGTNDFSNGDGKHERLPFDSALFVSHYIEFVQLVRSKYPAARIALLSSAMINGDARIKLQNCLTAVKTSIDRMYPAARPLALYFFKPMKARGCNGHPSVEDHGILAKELTPFFRDLLLSKQK